MCRGVSGALGDPGFSHCKPFANIAPFVGNLSLSSLPSLLSSFLFATPCEIFPNQGSNLGALLWKCGVLTTGPPGKSLVNFWCSVSCNHHSLREAFPDLPSSDQLTRLLFHCIMCLPLLQSADLCCNSSFVCGTLGSCL